MLAAEKGRGRKMQIVSRSGRDWGRFAEFWVGFMHTPFYFSFSRERKSCTNKKEKQAKGRGGMNIAIVAADFHKEIVEKMILHARSEAKKHGMKVVAVSKRSGCFDIPLALKRLLARNDIHGVVVLGAVVQGETCHDEVVAYTAAEKIASLSLQFDKPVGYGITGPRMTIAQAKNRAKDFAVRSTIAVARMLGPAKSEQ